MKVFTMCMECQRELGHPSFEPIIADYYEEATAFIECTRGHRSAILLQSQKFEVLLESAANALIEGYTLEAASSLSSAYERVFEFAINVFCKKSGVSKTELNETFKHVKKHSERQIGAFLFLHLFIFGKSYLFNTKIPKQRNKFIHQGHIPTPNEVIKFGEMIYQEIFGITKIIQSDCEAEMHEVIHDDLQLRVNKLPENMPRATTTGTIFFSLAMTERKTTFAEALQSYKDAREMIHSAVPYLETFSKAIAAYTDPRNNV